MRGLQAQAVNASRVVTSTISMPPHLPFHSHKPGRYLNHLKAVKYQTATTHPHISYDLNIDTGVLDNEKNRAEAIHQYYPRFLHAD